MKNKLLHVCGILMIIGGAIAIITGIVSLAGAGVLVAVGEGEGVAAFPLYAAIAISLVGGALELFAGIMGVKNCAAPDKAALCIVLGIAVIALCVISNALTLIAYPASFGILSVILGLVLPVLYLIGAVQLKNQQ